MEIQTTMMRFRFRSDKMEKSDKAHLLICGDGTERIWIPFTKAEVMPDPQSDAYCIVVMPKWLYMKTNLPFFTPDAEEFTYTHKYEINQ